MRFKVFVRHLKSYKENKLNLIKLDEKIKDFEYLMSGVGAVRYDIEHTSGNPAAMEERKLDNIETYNRLLKERLATESNITLIETILNEMPEDLRSALLGVYVENKTFNQVGEEMGYSGSGYWRYLKRETERYL